MHGQASKEARVYKNFAAPSAVAGESFVASYSDGVNGDDLSLFASIGSTSDGTIRFYLGGNVKMTLDSTILHMDESTAAATTLTTSGGLRLGTVSARIGMLWLNGFQFVSDAVAPTTWNSAPAFGFALVGATSVTGAAQTVTPPAQCFKLTAGAAASVAKISAPPGDYPTVLHIIFDNSNVTITNAGTGGAAETISMPTGDYTSRADGTLTLLWNNAPASGNKRWVELSRN